MTGSELTLGNAQHHTDAGDRIIAFHLIVTRREQAVLSTGQLGGHELHLMPGEQRRDIA